MNIWKTASVVALACVLAACAGRGTATPEDADTNRVGSRDMNGSATSATRGDGRGARIGDMEALEPDPADPVLSNMTIFFDFDRDNIRQEFIPTLDAHAAFLMENPRRRVRLEGHTDERGSREYNIGLGERRALSVRRYLLLQGVSADQLSTVSYGEERPAVLGSNEQAWSQNRRVELVYRP
ncbi:MAG: peptidoglycan-associated lipoprotein Pal [Gammaproteobacteria bacterium]|nr:peptidoglycan-associated lipoprotein Pal [Gammaproteobacteria bacterium]TVQ45267.1 MAG: peptidoglycan-associated lipoprotein Pal [Gammaproteobacteria bacterium]